MEITRGPGERGRGHADMNSAHSGSKNDATAAAMGPTDQQDFHIRSVKKIWGKTEKWEKRTHRPPI